MDRSSVTHSLTLRYVAALCLIAGLAAAGQGVLHWLIAGQEETATIVNRAGRQRMLSQRLVHLAMQGEQEKVTQTLEQWQAAHQELQAAGEGGGFDRRNSPEIQELFTELDPLLQGMTQAVQENERPDLAKLILLEGSFLRTMDRIVAQYEAEDRARVLGLRRAAIGTLVALLTLLVLSGLFVFRPAVSRLRRTMERQRETETALADLADLQRMQMSQELHDGLAPNLAGIAMLLRSDAPSSLAAEQLDAVMQTLRRLMSGLDPSPRLALGMEAALSELSREVLELHGLRLDLELELNGPFEGDVAAQLHRIAQEAVRNAARHARVEEARLKLSGQAEAFRLCVQDRGHGFESETGLNQGMGLRIMASRAQRIGAELTIESRPGVGTTIVCTNLGVGA